MEPPIERGRLRGISLTPPMASKGSRLENEAEGAVASRCHGRRRGLAFFPHPVTVLYFSFAVWCVITARVGATGPEETSSKLPLVPQTAGGDILLLHSLIKAIARSRAAMTAANKGENSAVTRPSINLGNFLKSPQSNYATNYSTDALKQMLYLKAQEWEKMKGGKTFPSASTSQYENVDSIINEKKDIQNDIVQYTNNGCPYNDVYMQANDECNAWKAFIFEYLFPWVLLLAILGNALTLAVYRSRYLKSAATVLLLAVKAQANLAFACCLTMEMLHYFVAEDSPFQDVYWRSRPYTLFLANYFDSLAVW